MAEETEQKLSLTFHAGTKIDNRYEIISKLGAGGFATVYKARHLLIDRDIALKIMDLQKCESDENFTERFLREAKIAGKIQHPNVVTIYDFGFVSETNQPYIAMELLDGYDLEHELEHIGPLSPNRAFTMLLPVLEALGEGHRMGIVHKDLKPANLFITDPATEREQVKILDFGVARMNTGQVAKLTTTGQLMGTPRYLAPEYIQAQICTPAIDVYQMGLIIAEALTGKPVIDSTNPFTAIMLHCNGDYELPDFLTQGPVGDVFRKALNLNYEERYQNCQEFADALNSVAEYFESTKPITGGQAQPAHTHSHSGRLSNHSYTNTSNNLPRFWGAITGKISTQIIDKDGQYRKTILIIAILGVLIIAAGIVVVIFLGKDSEETDVSPVVTETPKPEPENKETTAEPPKPQSVKFTFSSEPNGAQIRELDTENIICKRTPCEYSHEGSWPFEIEFVKDHFQAKAISLKEDSESLVFVTLEPQQQTFRFSTDPPGAKVKSADGSAVYCETTPCIHRFSPPWPIKVSVTLAGYITENIELTEDKDSNINLRLRKRKNSSSGRNESDSSMDIFIVK